MIPNPILKVLSTLSSHEVRHLLMGGQACVFYGAVEFSRDCDIAVLANEQNLAKISASRTALHQELEKEKLNEMQADAEYWRPLIRELESMRSEKRKRQE